MKRSERIKEAILVQEKNHRTLMALPNVVGTGTGLRQRRGKYTKELCVHVFVSRKHPREDLPESALVPTEISGPRGERIRTDVIEVGIFRPTQDTTRYRPIVGGSSFGSWMAFGGGTLGGWVCDMSDNSIVALTCNHVVTSAEDRSKMPTEFPSSAVFQPSLLDGSSQDDWIGVVKKIVPLSTSPNIDTPPNNSVDAAICTIFKPPKSTGFPETDVIDIGPGIWERAAAADNLMAMVQKRGRTTRLTQNGQIASVNVSSLAMDYGPGSGPHAYAAITPCFMIVSTDGTPFGAGGDSGSLVFLQQEGMVHGTFPTVGLYFSSDGTHFLACDIDSVFSAMNVGTVCNGLLNGLFSIIGT